MTTTAHGGPPHARHRTEPIDNLANLPWPFPDETTQFAYSVNVEPARIPRTTRAGRWGERLVDLGGSSYRTIMAERRRILDADPGRVKVRAGMDIACWDLLLYYLRDLDLSYPDTMHLDETAPSSFRWRNDLLGTDQSFTVGDRNSLPYNPIEFLAREVPDDLLLVIERDGHLYFDAGVVTFAAAWSVTFDVGMDMYEIHAPVPGLIRGGVVARAEQFLRQLRPEQVYRRVNWTLSASASDKLDISLEQLPQWAQDIPQMLEKRRFGDVRLRIELEHFVRLPMSGAVTFNIRTFMASLDEIRTIRPWAQQLAAVIETLDDAIASYKGFEEYRSDVVAYLRAP